ncbi:MAG: hypothetical protein J6J36_07225 [Clostridia bacterium]|nr:hypothetical protein [Clostridia bacterium]
MKKKFFISFIIAIFLFGCTSTQIYAEEVYSINNKEDLIRFAEEVNNGKSFEGVIVKLNSDIDLEGTTNNQWIPIGVTEETAGNFIEDDTERKSFKGTFEGNNHTISGIYMDGDSNLSGLFALNDGIIRNLNVKNSVINAAGAYSGAIAAFSTGHIINCNNYVDIKSTCSAGATGGIVGYATAGARIINCSNYGKVTNTNGAFCGGISGYTWASDIIRCINYADIVNEKWAAGGISGYSQTSNIYECANNGNVKSMRYSGGVIACLVGYSQMRYCYNTGDVTNINEDTKIMVGGLCGSLSMESTSSLVESCYNVGSISYTQSNAEKVNIGKLFGEIQGESTGKITKTYFLYENDDINAYGGDIKSDYETIAKETIELKSDEIVEVLNSTITDADIENDKFKLFSQDGKAYVKDINSDNSGYPIFYWQQKELPNTDIKNPDDNEDKKDANTYDKKNQSQEELDEKLYPQESEEQYDEEEKVVTSTTANTNIPQAGSGIGSYVTLAVIVIFIFIMYIKNKKYKNIE